MFSLITAKVATVVAVFQDRQATRGVTMLEYVLLGLLVVGVGLLLWTLFGNQLRDAFEELGDAIS